jgi:uncharacterized protein YjiS (DUF1127 family)
MFIAPHTGAPGGGTRPNPFARFRRALSAWAARARDARALAALDERAPKDIGLSCHDAVAAEVARRWTRP